MSLALSIHSVSLHTQADVWLVNNVGNYFKSKWCEHCHMTWRCTAPPWGFLWHFAEWVSCWQADSCLMFLWLRLQVGWQCSSVSFSTLDSSIAEQRLLKGSFLLFLTSLFRGFFLVELFVFWFHSLIKRACNKFLTAQGDSCSPVIRV